MRLAATSPSATSTPTFVALPAQLHPAVTTKLPEQRGEEFADLEFDVDVNAATPQDALEWGLHGAHTAGFESYAAGRDFHQAVDAAALLSRKGFGEWGAAGALAAVVQGADGAYYVTDTVGYVEDEDITFGAEHLDGASTAAPELTALVGSDRWVDLRPAH